MASAQRVNKIEMARFRSKPKTGTDERRGYARRLGTILPAEARKALRKFGFAEAEIVTKWSQIIGKELGERTLPIRLTYPEGHARGATLHLLVESGLALEIQHMEPLLLERINGHYGYAAVAKIALRQGGIQSSRGKPDDQIQPLSDDDKKALEEILENTQDEDLKDALTRLGRRVMSPKSK